MTSTAMPFRKQREGAMLVLIAVVMIIMIVGAVFSVDIAYMHMVRAELRTATDAAARAGAEVLSRSQDVDLAIDRALEIAEENLVSGDPLTLNRTDVVVGTVRDDNGRMRFFPDEQPFTSVRVTGTRRQGSPDGPVGLIFAPMLGTGNFQPQQAATASASVRDIALVLDRSGSMNISLGAGTRLTALQSAVSGFLSEVRTSSPSSQISLTTYSTRSTRDIALTNNFDQIQTAVDNLRGTSLTNIFQALRQGSDSLEQDARRRPFADQTIILMTDGIFNEGGTPIPSARRAARRGHQIHTITFSPRADQTTMRQVADIGGGRHIHADTATDLEEAFREIARSLAVVLVE